MLTCFAHWFISFLFYTDVGFVFNSFTVSILVLEYIEL